MMRVNTAFERNIFSDPPRVVTLVATTATELFPDQRQSRGEICSRFIQNLTGDYLYLSFGLSAADGLGGPVCDATALYHVRINDGELFDCSPDRGRVCGYALAGGPVATTLKYRVDMAHTTSPL